MECQSLISPIINIISDKKTNAATKETLLKLFMIECRNNQKLLAIASWKDVDIEDRGEALKNLCSHSAKMYFAFTNKSILGVLLEKVKSVLRRETKDEQMQESKIISLITRIDSLQFLGSIISEHKKQNKGRLSVRISNLKAINIEIIKDLENHWVNANK